MTTYQYGYLGAQKPLGQTKYLDAAVKQVEEIAEQTDPEKIEFTNYIYIIVSYNDDEVYHPLLVFDFINGYWSGEQ